MKRAAGGGRKSSEIGIIRYSFSSVEEYIYYYSPEE
jgi:hypothetical protein